MDVANTLPQRWGIPAFFLRGVKALVDVGLFVSVPCSERDPQPNNRVVGVIAVDHFSDLVHFRQITTEERERVLVQASDRSKPELFFQAQGSLQMRRCRIWITKADQCRRNLCPRPTFLTGEICLASEFKRFEALFDSATVVTVNETGPAKAHKHAPFEPSITGVFRDLESLGVQVWTSRPVTEVDASGVVVGEERIGSYTTLWAAGVQPSSLNRELGSALDAEGRVIVRPDLSLPGHSEVFVAGDQAHVRGRDGEPLPGLAPVAMQQGRYLSRRIRAELRGEVCPTFAYRDRGKMATIGRSRAICQTPHFQFAGRLAWFAWLLVHIYYLVGFKNRLFVVLQWAWAHLTFRRGARLIVSKEWRFYTPGRP